MPGPKSRLLYFVMRNRHLLRFRLKREAWDFNTSIPQFRQICEQQNGRMARLPDGIEVEPLTVEGMRSVIMILCWTTRPASPQKPKRLAWRSL